jgi:CubicO group peptidase (beta-lactamase class C family)
MKLLLLITALLCAAPAAWALEAADAQRRIEAPQSPDRGGYDALSLEQLMQRLRVPGLSVAVILDFKLHWAKGYGLADVETATPVRTDTGFQAASISKPVTALAVVRLAQQGRVQLDADINTTLRGWRVPVSELNQQQPVTWRALLSHNAGADDGFGFPGYAPGAPRPTVPQVLAGEKPSNVGAVTFGRAPFVAHKYSGASTTVVQQALMDFAQEPFEALMRRTVLEPLAMHHSSFEQPPPPAAEPRLARAHNAQGRRHDSPWHIYPEQAAAGLWTTPTDLALLVVEVQRALRQRSATLLTAASARELVSAVGTGPFAVGFQLESRGEGWYFSHGGANRGFRAVLVGHVLKGYGAVVMSNGDNGNPLVREVEARIAAAYGWDSLHKPLPR